GAAAVEWRASGAALLAELALLQGQARVERHQLDAEPFVIAAGRARGALAAVAVVVELDALIEQGDEQRVGAGLLEGVTAGVALDDAPRRHVARAIAAGAEPAFRTPAGERNGVLVLDAVVGLG